MRKFKKTALVAAAMIVGVSIFSSLKTYAAEHPGVKTTIGGLTTCNCPNTSDTCTCRY